MNKTLKLNRQFGAAFLVLLLYGCGADPAAQSETADMSVESTASAQTTESQATFIAPLVGGGNFNSAEVLATKPIAFWFWAPG